jgi:hypothetical protein
MAGRNLFRPNAGNDIMANRQNGPSHRDRMLAQRQQERGRAPPRNVAPAANTYEGRRAQEERYKQDVARAQAERQQQEKQRQQERFQNKGQKAAPVDYNAKAATNQAISQARSSKAQRDQIWEEKRRAHAQRRHGGGGAAAAPVRGQMLPATGPSGVAANTRAEMPRRRDPQMQMQMQQPPPQRQPQMQMQQQQPPLHRAPQQGRPSQPTSASGMSGPMTGAPPADQARKLQRNSQANYAAELQNQIMERKQLELRNDTSRNPTSNMAIGSNAVPNSGPNSFGDPTEKRRMDAKKNYANELREQMQLQEQRKAREKAEARRGGGGAGGNDAYFGGNHQPTTGVRSQQQNPVDPVAQQNLTRQRQYKAELDAQMQAKQQHAMARANEVSGGGMLFGGNRQPVDGSRMNRQPRGDSEAQRNLMRQRQYKADLDAQMQAKQRANMSNAHAAGGNGGLMGQMGRNMQPLDGRRHRGGAASNMYGADPMESQAKLAKKQRENAYLAELDAQIQMKNERKKMENMKLQEEERRHMEKAQVGLQPIGAAGVNRQASRAKSEMYSRGGGINTNPNRAVDALPNRVQQVGPGPVGQLPLQNMGGMGYRAPQGNMGGPQQANNMPHMNMSAVNGMGQPMRAGMGMGAAPGGQAGLHNQARAHNQQDHLSMVLNERVGANVNNDPEYAKHRFRDGLKDPAEIDALMQRHEQAKRQNALLSEQVEANRRRKEAQKAKEKMEAEQEELRLQRERDELKKAYDDEIKAKKAKKEAEQKTLLDEQIKAKKRAKELEQQRERERQRKEDERIAKDRAELAKQYQYEKSGRTPPHKKGGPANNSPAVGEPGGGLGRTPTKSPPNERPANGRPRPMIANAAPQHGRPPRHNGGEVSKEQQRIRELEERLASAEKKMGGGGAPNQFESRKPGSAPAPATPPARQHRSPRGNETIRKEQQSLLRKHDNMREQMEKQMRLLKEMQVKLDVREAESDRYKNELAKLKGMVQEEKQKQSAAYLEDFVHSQEKALSSQIDEELTRLLEGGPATPKAFRGESDSLKMTGMLNGIQTVNLNPNVELSPLRLTTSPQKQNMAAGLDALDNYMQTTAQQNKSHGLNESIPSQSKFVFPDGQTAAAPASSLSARAPSQPRRQSPLKLSPIRGDNSFLAEYNAAGSPGGGIGQLTDGQSVSMDDTLNVDYLMGKNADKLAQLEQLGSSGAGDLATDQLDQMLIDFLNKNNGSSLSGAVGPGPSGTASLISPEMRQNGLRQSRPSGLPALKIQSLDESFGRRGGESFGGASLQTESRFIGTSQVNLSAR